MEIITVKPENNEQLKAVKAALRALKISFVAQEEQEYDPLFVSKIETSRRQAKEGKVTPIDPKTLWK